MIILSGPRAPKLWPLLMGGHCSTLWYTHGKQDPKVVVAIGWRVAIRRWSLGVNFINILRTNFSSSFRQLFLRTYVHMYVKKAAKTTFLRIFRT